jgi:hypothetical protein
VRLQPGGDAAFPGGQPDHGVTGKGTLFTNCPGSLNKIFTHAPLFPL